MLDGLASRANAQCMAEAVSAAEPFPALTEHKPEYLAQQG